MSTPEFVVYPVDGFIRLEMDASMIRVHFNNSYRDFARSEYTIDITPFKIALSRNTRPHYRRVQKARIGQSPIPFVEQRFSSDFATFDYYLSQPLTRESAILLHQLQQRILSTHNGFLDRMVATDEMHWIYIFARSDYGDFSQEEILSFTDFPDLT